jgi:hypothetical protein
LGPQPTLVRDFLCRFDKIFTLNQDTLLEQHYLDSGLLDGSAGRWFTLQTPGLVEMKVGGSPCDGPVFANAHSGGRQLADEPSPYVDIEFH